MQSLQGQDEPGADEEIDQEKQQGDPKKIVEKKVFDKEEKFVVSVEKLIGIITEADFLRLTLVLLRKQQEE